MSRRMAVIGFALGVIAAPIIFSFFAVVSRPAIAQEDDLREITQEEDLIVIQPVEVTADVYLKLVKEKIELLTTEELARETEILRKELAELQAARKLREAEQKLEQLIEQYPVSSVAERARIMLQAGRRPQEMRLAPTPQVPRDTFGDPIDDSQFESPNPRRKAPNGVPEVVPPRKRGAPLNQPFNPDEKS